MCGRVRRCNICTYINMLMLNHHNRQQLDITHKRQYLLHCLRSSLDHNGSTSLSNQTAPFSDYLLFLWTLLIKK